MVNAYAVIVDSDDESAGLLRICGSQEHALNTYRELTGKPGAHVVTDPNAPAPQDLLEVDVTPTFRAVIAKYSFEVVEQYDAD